MREKSPAPNAYFTRLNEKIVRQGKVAFDAKAQRFSPPAMQEIPPLGHYNVTEDVGRQVHPWRRAPQEYKDNKS